MMLAPAAIAASALPSVEPSSTTMISDCGSFSAWTLSISAAKPFASLKTGMTMEISYRLAIELVDGVATVSKIQFQAVLRELVPRRSLNRRQIMPQEIYQKIFPDH